MTPYKKKPRPPIIFSINVTYHLKTACLYQSSECPLLESRSYPWERKVALYQKQQPHLQQEQQERERGSIEQTAYDATQSLEEQRIIIPEWLFKNASSPQWAKK